MIVKERKRLVIIKSAAIGSFCFLLLGHVFTAIGILRLIEAALWGFNKKDTFSQSFLSALASANMQSRTLTDGTITFQRIGLSPTSELIMLIIIPLVCYFAWYSLRKIRKGMEKQAHGSNLDS